MHAIARTAPLSLQSLLLLWIMRCRDSVVSSIDISAAESNGMFRLQDES
jgi:hypothetical protein